MVKNSSIFFCHIMIVNKWNIKKFCQQKNCTILMTLFGFSAIIAIMYHIFEYTNVHIQVTNMPLKTNLKPVTTYKEQGVKYILYWGETADRTISNCPGKCVITSNRMRLNTVSDFDAIIFNYRELDKLVDKELPNPMFRRQSQRYVMALTETPQNYKYNYDRCIYSLK